MADPTPLRIAQKQPNKDLVEQLTLMLAEAKAGEMTGIAAISVITTGAGRYHIIGIDDRWKLLGFAHHLAHELHCDPPATGAPNPPAA